MVHKLAKTLVILFLSVIAAYLLSAVIAGVLANQLASAKSDSSIQSFAALNYFFGWIIYAIPLAIIGFKLYPEQKSK